MEEYDVAVIMPAYLHADYIGIAIESVLSQATDVRIQLLIGDDCSPDNTEHILSAFLQRPTKVKIKYYRHTENIGLMRNYAFLLSKVSAKYIAILEGDDYWTSKSKIQEQFNYLESHPCVGVSHTAAGNLHENGIIINDVHKSRGPKVYNGIVFNKLLLQNFVKPLTMMFKYDLYKRHVCIDQYIALGFKTFDYPVLLELSQHCQVQFLDKQTAIYRVLGTSISNTSNIFKKVEFGENMELIASYFMGKYRVSNKLRNAIIRNFRIKRIRILLTNGEIELAQRLVENSKQFGIPFKWRVYVKYAVVSKVLTEIVKSIS